MTPTDFKNLGVFLSRVNLTGQEAPTFNELLLKIKELEESYGKDKGGAA